MRITPKTDGSMLEWTRVQGLQSDMPVVVSFFTDLFYLREAWELARSCQTFGLDYHILQVPDTGGWSQNTNHKPSFLADAVWKFKDRSVLWLDADARIRSFPSLLKDLHSPIAYHTIERKPASGTVFLGRGHLREAVVERWIQEVADHPSLTDQVCMERAVNGLGVVRGELPAEYCWIYDYDKGARQLLHPSPETCAPVIEHTQASRWFKLLMEKRRRK